MNRIKGLSYIKVMRTVAIVTVYYPTEKNVRNVMTISKQVDTVIVFDNSSEKNEEMFAGISNCKYYCEKRNLGLSESFNQVLKSKSYDWKDDDFVVFFDQDSEISEQHVDMLICEYMSVSNLGFKIGCIGPLFYNMSNKKIEKPRKYKRINEQCLIVEYNITSSLLCKYSTLKEVGFWNKKLFLDLADWDICWRMQEQGFDCCMTEKIIMRHALGEGEKKIGFFSLRVGKPFREYYQTRDCLYLLPKKYVPVKFKVRFIGMLTIRPILHICFLGNAKERLLYIIKGIKDYHAGIEGALE